MALAPRRGTCEEPKVAFSCKHLPEKTIVKEKGPWGWGSELAQQPNRPEFLVHRGPSLCSWGGVATQGILQLVSTNVSRTHFFTESAFAPSVQRW